MEYTDPEWSQTCGNCSSITTVTNTVLCPENSTEENIKDIENTLQQGIIKERVSELYARLAKTEDSTELHLIRLEAQLYSKMLQDLITSRNDDFSWTLSAPTIRLSGMSSSNIYITNSQETLNSSTV